MSMFQENCVNDSEGVRTTVMLREIVQFGGPNPGLKIGTAHPIDGGSNFSHLTPKLVIKGN